MNGTAKIISFSIYYIIGAVIIWWLSGNIMQQNAVYGGENAAIMVIFGWGPIAISGLPIAMGFLHKLIINFAQSQTAKDKLTAVVSILAILLFAFSPYAVSEWEPTIWVTIIIAISMFTWALIGAFISQN